LRERLNTTSSGPTTSPAASILRISCGSVPLLTRVSSQVDAEDIISDPLLFVGNSALRGAGDQFCVLGQHAAGIEWFRLHPARAAFGEYGIRHSHTDFAGFGIDTDDITVFDQCNRPAIKGFRGDMSDDKTVGATGE